jgi:hypothetical protein
MKRSNLTKRNVVVLISIIVLSLVGTSLGYYYLLRVEDKCDQFNLGAERACYTIKLFNTIPIANMVYSFNPQPQDGSRTIFMHLSPIGIAKRFADGVRFEATSTFDSVTHRPLLFSLTSHDKSGIRSIKTTVYDFDKKILTWQRISPNNQNREHKNEVAHIRGNTYGPISGFYHMIDSSTKNGTNGDLELELQVKNSVYTLRGKVQGSNRVSHPDNGIGNLKKTSIRLSKHKDFHEPWRRRKELNVRLFFAPNNASPKVTDPFPLKIALPFYLITLHRAT